MPLTDQEKQPKNLEEMIKKVNDDVFGFDMEYPVWTIVRETWSAALEYGASITKPPTEFSHEIPCHCELCCEWVNYKRLSALLLEESKKALEG